MGESQGAAGSGRFIPAATLVAAAGNPFLTVTSEYPDTHTHHKISPQKIFNYLKRSFISKFAMALWRMLAVDSPEKLLHCSRGPGRTLGPSFPTPQDTRLRRLP